MSSADFTNQLPWVVQEGDPQKPWSGYKDGSSFRCIMCGHKFVVGDYIRWVAGQGTQNFFVCEKDDSGDVAKRYAQKEKDSHDEYWWLWRDVYDARKEIDYLNREFADREREVQQAKSML